MDIDIELPPPDFTQDLLMETTQYIPPAPPKKSRTKTVLLTIADTQLQIMRLVWDTEITATDRANICDYYNTPPVGTTPEMVEVFASAAEMPYDAADRLLDQLLAEKC